MIFGGQDRRDNRDKAQDVATMESSTELTTEAVTESTVEARLEPTMEPEEENQETGAEQEPQADSESQAEKEQQEERTVLAVEGEGPSEEEIAAMGIREDMLAYWLVLNNKKPFVSMNEDGQKFFWNEYFWFLECVDTSYQAYKFMIVDMDGDGREEVVVECDPGTSHVLHYEDGEVYGYQFGIRGMKRIHKSGIYDASGGAADNYFLRIIELTKDGYKEEILAEMHSDYYEVEGKEATCEEFFDYVDSIESVELADKMEFTESMLDLQFLGNLSEQEIALVKRIPEENMPENEPDYQEHKQALQLYAAVLSGEEEEIHVTVDAWPWDDEPERVYFSLVDMDGDGICELVFSCYYCVTQILHYEDGRVYCYEFHPENSVVTTDGVIQTDDGYIKIVSFEKDGCRIEPVEDYDSGSHQWTRYYFYSEETMAQWLD